MAARNLLLAAIPLCVLLGCGRTDEALKDAAMELGTDDEQLRRKLESKLFNAGRRSINPLVRALKLGSLDTRIRCVELLRRVGEKEGGSLVDAEIEGAVKALVEAVAIRSPDGSFKLSTKNEKLKLAVAQALGELPAEMGVQVLLLCLDDSSPAIRTAARNSLVKCGGRGAEHMMRCSFADGSEAAALLQGCIFELVDTLVAQLTDRNEYEDIRRKAADALRIIGGTYIRDPVPLCDFLLDTDESLRQRRIVSYLLAEMDPTRTSAVKDSLRVALEDEDGVISLNAAKALSHTGDRAAVDFVVGRLEDSNALVRLSADDALDELGKFAGEQLTAHIANEDERVRNAIARVLPVLEGEEAGPTLIELLSDADGDIRVAAALGIGRLRYKMGIYYLVRALDDRRPSVRYYAMWALREFGDEAFQPLKATAETFDPYPCNKLAEAMDDAAFEWFGKLGMDMRRAAMDEALRLEIFARRMNLPVNHALLVTPKDNADGLPPLIVDAREAKAFISAAGVLAGLCEEDILELVADCTQALSVLGVEVGFCRGSDLARRENGPIPIRMESAPLLLYVLAAIPHQVSIRIALECLELDYTWRENLPFTRAGMWLIVRISAASQDKLPERERVVSRLVTLLEECLPPANAATAVKNAYMAVREQAAQALGVMGGKDIVKPLLRALVSESEYRVRLAASESLAQIVGGAQASDLVRQYELALNTDDPEIRLAAVSKLGALGDMRAVATLKRILRDTKEDMSLREAASSSLKTLTGIDHSAELSQGPQSTESPPTN